MKKSPPILGATVRWRGFSLLELIAVLALMALLAAALIPFLNWKLDTTARNQEEANLTAIANAVQSYAIRAHSVPDHTTLAGVIAPELGWTPANVLTNARSQSRLILFDSAIRFGPGSGSLPPYSQTMNGSILPVSPRLLLVSSLGAALPASLTNGYLSSNSFYSIWNTAPNTIPSGWSWNGRPDDLKIQRINLSPLFVQLVLNKKDSGICRYMFDSLTTNTLPSVPFSTYVLKGTRLSLYDEFMTLQAVEVINQSRSLVYDANAWRSTLSDGSNTSWATRHWNGADLQAVANFFLTAPTNPNKGAVSPATMLGYWSNFMTLYNQYGAAGFDNKDYKAATKDAIDTIEDALKTFAK